MSTEAKIPMPVLDLASELISNQNRWLKTGGYFKSDDFTLPPFYDVNADLVRKYKLCLCAAGAIIAATNSLEPTYHIPQRCWKYEELARDQHRQHTGMDIPAFNDHPNTTHADIMLMFESLKEWNQ